MEPGFNINLFLSVSFSSKNHYKIMLSCETWLKIRYGHQQNMVHQWTTGKVKGKKLEQCTAQCQCSVDIYMNL